MNPCSTSSSAFSINYKRKMIPLTYSEFQHRLKELIGLNPKLISPNSFRRGDATLATQAGISSSLIQLMGEWKSDAYKKSKDSNYHDKNKRDKTTMVDKMQHKQLKIDQHERG